MDFLTNVSLSPELRDKTTTWELMLGTIVVYLVVVFSLKFFVMDRKGKDEKFELKQVMMVYNAMQVLLCAYVGLGLLACCWDWANPFGLNTKYNAAVEWFIYVHYVSKYLDLLDTVFIVLKKNYRQLSFLHVYHHASILIIWGFLLKEKQAFGTVFFGANINSWIHVIMYSHYLISSLGIRNPFKAYITLAQIGQMYLCLIHALIALFVEKEIRAELAKIQAAYHVTMIILFTHFYRQNYLAERKHKDDAAKAARAGKKVQ